MKNKRATTDGFVPRRPQRAQIRSLYEYDPHNTLGRNEGELDSTSEMHTGDGNEALRLESPSAHSTLKDDMNESLAAIDTEATETPRKKRRKNAKKRRRIKIIVISIVLALLIAGGAFLYKAWDLGSRVFGGGTLFDIFHQQPLKKDKNGRSNVLILGSTDDIAGRDGASLTDSMMVVSVDQEKKDAYMFSVPRDLWVRYGRACLPGYEGKINAFYACALDDGKDDAKAMDATRELVGKVFAMDIQYAAHINTVVIRDAVNAVGGITVNVQSEDPRGVLDATFGRCRDVKGATCPPNEYYLKFPNGPNQMNGDQAMAFSQARGHTAPTYGLSGSNFDREKNQQLVMMALLEKATSTGTLTDIGKILGLMDAMGDNLRTNVDAKEVRTIADLGAKITPTAIHRLAFFGVKDTDDLMTTGSAGGQSIVRPVAGLYEYSQIRAYLRDTIFATPVSSERANVFVLNGSDTAGRAGQEATKLAELGMDASAGNAPDGTYSGVKVYHIGDAKQHPATRTALQEAYGVSILDSQPPFAISQPADFVVVIGN